jgi:hypothetical protein
MPHRSDDGRNKGTNGKRNRRRNLLPGSHVPISQRQDTYPLVAFKATSYRNTMDFHQAMKEPNKNEFVAAMQKKVQEQAKKGNFTLTHHSKLPKNATVLPSVWQMKQKQNIRTRQVKKYKARLNIDGSHMQKGIHYEEKYSPVISWNSLCLLLTLTAVHGWHMKQLD